MTRSEGDGLTDSPLGLERSVSLEGHARPQQAQNGAFAYRRRLKMDKCSAFECFHAATAKIGESFYCFHHYGIYKQAKADGLSRWFYVWTTAWPMSRMAKL